LWIFILHSIESRSILFTVYRLHCQDLQSKRKAFQLPRYYLIISSTITSDQPPAWFRALQIGSGIIAITLSIILIVTQYPVIGVNTIIALLSITLLTIGVERVGTGIMLLKLYSSLPTSKRPSGRSKKVTPFTNVGLGIVAIVFAIIALISPTLVSEISLNLFSVAISVMFNGFARITQGTFDRSQSTWFRAFSIGIGAFSIGTSIYVTNSKMFGIIFPIRTLFIVLLIYGASMIVYGSTGKLSLDKILKKKVHSTDE
jgi:hypothetical protein